jgi:peptidase E
VTECAGHAGYTFCLFLEVMPWKESAPVSRRIKEGTTTSGCSALWIMSRDTATWKHECSNRSEIGSAQKCYPCLRYVVSPMSPGRTSNGWWT